MFLMKSFVVFAIILISQSGFSATKKCATYSFWGPAATSPGRTQEFCEHPALIEIQYDLKSDEGQMAEIQLNSLLAEASVKPKATSLRQTSIHTVVLSIGDISPLRNQLQNIAGLIIRPIYTETGSPAIFIAPQGEFLLTFSSSSTIKEIVGLMTKYKLRAETPILSEYQQTFVFSRKDLTGPNDLELASLIAREPGVEIAEPNFLEAGSIVSNSNQ